eukprot:TRINITY_DN1305_c0_g1_i1.p1 TRINITY_DN1305_c0_g1~~TRINITY_DN1305_c0_g1_i1.p1  ORF type:complete len:161 (-),score=0.80 TRINITY_DN1305_c0_g1_i1:74-556(-)
MNQVLTFTFGLVFLLSFAICSEEQFTPTRPNIFSNCTSCASCEVACLVECSLEGRSHSFNCDENFPFGTMTCTCGMLSWFRILIYAVSGFVGLCIILIALCCYCCCKRRRDETRVTIFQPQNPTVPYQPVPTGPLYNVQDSSPVYGVPGAQYSGYPGSKQ